MGKLSLICGQQHLLPQKKFLCRQVTRFRLVFLLLNVALKAFDVAFSLPLAYASQ